MGLRRIKLCVGPMAAVNFSIERNIFGSDSTPKVIKDAFLVTKKLGYRYLWVDRYCIVQDDAQEKHQQIKNMGSIYENARVTIVAAAGSDPTY